MYPRVAAVDPQMGISDARTVSNSHARESRACPVVKLGSRVSHAECRR